jgi:hypothetical protein
MSQSQSFIFPSNIWDLIIEDLDGSSLKNLTLTCKYFYGKHQDIIKNYNDHEVLLTKYGIVSVGRLDLVSTGSKERCHGIEQCRCINHLILSPDNDFPVKKLIVKDVLKSITRRPLDFILPKVYCFRLIELSMEFNSITWKEYLLLTETGRIEKLSLEGVNIIDSKNNQVSVDQIMYQIPMADEIHIQPCYFAPSTLLRLILLQHHKNIAILNLLNISGCFSSISFFDFLKKNLRQTAQVMIHFSYNAEDNTLSDAYIAELSELFEKRICRHWYGQFLKDYPRNIKPPSKKYLQDEFQALANLFDNV